MGGVGSEERTISDGRCGRAFTVYMIFKPSAELPTPKPFERKS